MKKIDVSSDLAHSWMLFCLDFQRLKKKEKNVSRNKEEEFPMIDNHNIQANEADRDTGIEEENIVNQNEEPMVRNNWILYVILFLNLTFTFFKICSTVKVLEKFQNHKTFFANVLFFVEKKEKNASRNKEEEFPMIDNHNIQTNEAQRNTCIEEENIVTVNKNKTPHNINQNEEPMVSNNWILSAIFEYDI